MASIRESMNSTTFARNFDSNSSQIMRSLFIMITVVPGIAEKSEVRQNHTTLN